MGYIVPPGISDATVPNPTFNLTPAATVDEGNNWINMTYGPLSLANPTLASFATSSGSPTGIPQGTANGNYELTGASTNAIGQITASGAAANYALAPSVDLLGTQRKTDRAVDIGAIEFVAPNYAIASVTPTSLAFGSVGTGQTSPSQTLTLHNTGGASLTGITVTVTSPYSRPAGGAGGNCGSTLAAASTCTINIVFAPTVVGPTTNATVTISGSVAVTGSPVALSGTGVTPAAVVAVTPTQLQFGSVVNGTNSSFQTLTLANTGTATFTGLTLGFPANFARQPAPNAGSCGTTLTAGANCTINVRFSPTAPAKGYSAPLTITGSVTVTGSPVTLIGTGLVPGTVTINPNPLTITLPTGTPSGTGTVTLTNTSTTTPVTITNVAVAGGNILTYFFNGVNGADNCSNATLAPGGTCTVGVRFTNVSSARGVNRSGTITFTDNATGSPQAGTLTGHANP